MDNVLFIPRADFLWYFKYYLTNEQVDLVIELKKRSTSIAETELEIATIRTRRYYAFKEDPADIIYTRKASESAKEAVILKNTTGAITRLDQLLVDFRADTVMSHPY